MAPLPVPTSATSASALVPKDLDRPLHEPLGLRARDQHGGTDGQAQAVELLEPEEVLQRLAGSPPPEEGEIAPRLVGRQLPRGLEVDVEAADAEDPGEQPLRLTAGGRGSRRLQERHPLAEQGERGGRGDGARHRTLSASFWLWSQSRRPSISSSRSPSITAGSRCRVRLIR